MHHDGSLDYKNPWRMHDCLSKAKRPLPGTLDHRTFERVKVEIGRCDICGERKAV